ncbi:hypothetical protein ACJVDH_15170 [Pedobacter sp. AW1-32]|uniref:hypothetical protein n=1 Tax=Pedobacter sp. AW1-32 TaxID=3383026 RepID=UPI003FED8D4D
MKKLLNTFRQIADYFLNLKKHAAYLVHHAPVKVLKAMALILLVSIGVNLYLYSNKTPPSKQINSLIGLPEFPIGAVSSLWEIFSMAQSLNHIHSSISDSTLIIHTARSLDSLHHNLR